MFKNVLHRQCVCLYIIYHTPQSNEACFTKDKHTITHTKIKTDNVLETHCCEVEVRTLVPQVGIKPMQYPRDDILLWMLNDI